MDADVEDDVDVDVEVEGERAICSEKLSQMARACPLPSRST